jgi:hypothetical protein
LQSRVVRQAAEIRGLRMRGGDFESWLDLDADRGEAP